MSDGPRVIVFARYPTPGAAKTRLVPALGAAGAARLQQDMTRRTLRVVGAFAAGRDADVEIRSTGESTAAMRERYGGRWACVDQGGGDLGERLRRATDAAFER